jgi:hypothetical protein
MRVRIHFNLNKKRRKSHDGKFISLATYQKKVGWRKKEDVVIGYLTNVELKVYESGYNRCIKEGVRNVHAYIFGDWEDFKTVGVEMFKPMREISYNPFKCNYFYYVDTGEQVKHINSVLIFANKLYQFD